MPPNDSTEPAPEKTEDGPLQSPTPTEAPVEPAETGLPTESTAPTSPATAPQASDVSNASVSNMPVAGPAKKGKKKWLVALVVVGLILILVGGSAAAYLGVVVPNKPENVLKAAIKKSLQQNQVTMKGTFTYDDPKATESDLRSFVVDFTYKADLEKHNVDIDLQPKVAGLSFHIQARAVNGSAYVQVGDLSSLKNIAAISNSEVAALIDKINTQIANQWLEFDSTLLKQAQVDCLGDYPHRLSDDDINLLMDNYKNNQFTSIKSTKDEKVGATDSSRYDLSFDDKKAQDFTKNLDDLSLVKDLKQCTDKYGSTSSSLEDSVNTDVSSGSTDLTVWVDKANKTVNQVELKVSDGDSKGSLKATLSYGVVTVTKPEGAKPALEVLSSLYASFGLDSTDLLTGGVQTKAKDTERQTDIKAIYGQLEAYYAQNGKYPTLANMNDASWRSVNMKGLDNEALKDPDGTTTGLVAAPATHVYSYAPAASDGKTGCDNVTVDCATYTLTATLDAGNTYVKQNLN